MRAQLQGHVASLLGTASRQILAGDAASLQALAGAAWTRHWATTASFRRWTAANRLHGAARLWRASPAATDERA